MNLFAKLGALACLSALLEGCGGSGSPTQSSAPGGETAVGSARVKFQGNPKPFVSSSTYGITVQGLVGAAFSYVDMYPQPSLLNTMLVYQRSNDLWTYSFLTGQAQQITHTLNSTDGLGKPTWGQNGLIIYPNQAQTGLVAMYADGSHMTALPTAGVVSHQSCSWDGSKIAGLDANGNFVVMYANGSNVTRYLPAAKISTSFLCTWLGNTILAYTDSNNTISFISSTGTALPITPLGYENVSAIGGYSDASSSLIVDADSYLVAASWTPSSLISAGLSPSGVLDTSPTIAPDNETLAFHRQKTAGANDGYSGIWLATVGGDNPQLLIPDSDSTNQIARVATNICWSPYPTYRRFIGTGGAVATAASGFLTSQLGAGLSAFFSMVAKTPSTATFTPAQSTGSVAPLVYSVHADSITGMWWKNGYSLPATTIASTGTTDAVVSFDGTTGQITFVSPALATRGISEKPRIARIGPNTVCSGHFAAIYDLNGKNLAPSGASTIEIDGKGKLVSFKQ